MFKAPWQRNWLKVTPEKFEEMTAKYLRDLKRELNEFTVTKHATLRGPDGEFVLDAVARFEVFGAEFVVVIECKHHKHPVKRELIQVLRDKARSVKAQKAMMFSTGGFQKGAIAYAKSQGIALVHFTEGGPIYETRAFGGQEGLREYDQYYVTLNEAGNLIYGGSAAEVTDFLFGS